MASSVFGINKDKDETPTDVEAKARAEMEEAQRIRESKMSEEDKVREVDMRRRAQEEILSTESTYLNQIRLLHECFCVPLAARAAPAATDRLSLTPAQVQSLTNNLSGLVKIHEHFLEELKAPEAKLPALFIQYADLFLAYSDYLSGYERALNTFGDLKGNNKFQQFMVDCRSDLNSKSGTTLDLLSFLILPVQRIPRYLLLLNELQRHTLYSHPEFSSLLDAIAKVKKIATKLNESKRAIENMQALLKIAEGIKGEIPPSVRLILPHRRLLKQGELQVTTRSGFFSTIKTSVKFFYLFNDSLLWTNLEQKFKGFMDLTAAELVVRDGCFELSTFKKHLLIRCKSADELKQWALEIEQIIREQKEERLALSKRIGEQKAKAKAKDYQNYSAVHSKIQDSLANIPMHQQEREAKSPGYDDAKILPSKVVVVNKSNQSSPQSSPKHAEQQNGEQAKQAQEKNTEVPTKITVSEPPPTRSRAGQAEDPANDNEAVQKSKVDGQADADEKATVTIWDEQQAQAKEAEADAQAQANSGSGSKPYKARYIEPRGKLAKKT